MTNEEFHERRKRVLSDADVEALLDAVERRFHINVGRGIFAFAWKAIVIILLVLASYGAGLKGLFK